MTYQKGVGGEIAPVNRFNITALWLGLAVFLGTGVIFLVLKHHNVK